MTEELNVEGLNINPKENDIEVVIKGIEDLLASIPKESYKEVIDETLTEITAIFHLYKTDLSLKITEDQKNRINKFLEDLTGERLYDNEQRLKHNKNVLYSV